MNINIIDAVYCPRHNLVVSLKVCRRGFNDEGCSFYRKEKTRTDGVRELICSYGEKSTPSKKDKQNEVLHQLLGVDGWQEIYADAPSEEDIRKEMAEDIEKEKRG